MMGIRTAAGLLGTLALGIVLAASACAPGSSSSAAGGEGVKTNGMNLTGSLPVGTVLIATTDVNLRTGPSSAYPVLNVVSSGDTVIVVASDPEGGFYNVSYVNEIGWSSGAYYQIDTAAGSSSGAGGSPSSGAGGSPSSGAGGSPSSGAGGSPSSSSSSSSGATTWSCTGLYGTIPMANGEYYATEFGCYIDSNGNAQQDPGDNCIPACLAQAQSSGLCAGMSGPDCEDSVNWYSADGARFGCLTRLKVTNQANGMAVVVVALDYGPGCSVEATVSHAAINLSYPADAYLFGGETGISDEALVHVDIVDPSTPLGPVM